MYLAFFRIEMSVVARQSFKYTIIGYLGFLLGTFSAIFIFPRDFEFYGKLRFIMNTAELMVPFIVFGISYSTVKFFYQTHNDKKHHNMLSLSVLGVIFNFLIITLLFFGASYLFPDLQNLQLWKYRYFVIPLSLILAISALFNKFTSNYKRIVIPNIFDNLFPKIANITAFCLFFFLGVSQTISFAVFFAFFVFSMLGYISYTNKLEKITPDFSTDYFKSNGLSKAFISYSFFAFLGTFGSYLTINNYMIGELFGMEEVGIYWILYSMISLISIPQLGLFNVSAPIINEYLSENKLEDLDRFYKKTSLHLFFLGAVLFSCIVVGFPYLTSFIKNGAVLRFYQPVIWIWGTAILFDLATGFNGNIISLSKYYKFNILVMLLLAVLTIILNFYFANNTNLKLVGIAISTAISLTIYNCIKIIFNFVKFKVSPFSIEMIFASIVCTLSITVSLLMPDFSKDFINLIYKPFIVLILVFIGNYFLQIFPIKDFFTKDFFKSILKF